MTKSALDQRDMLLRVENQQPRYRLPRRTLTPRAMGSHGAGAPRRTVRMIAGHIHNARCMWIKTLGKEHGIAVPGPVSRHKVGRRS